MTILSGHVVVLPTGETAKVIDRSPSGGRLYVTRVAFGSSGGALKMWRAEAVRLATAEEIAGSVFAKEFHLPAPEKKI